MRHCARREPDPLQAMGFIVDKADATLGFITATKLDLYTRHRRQDSAARTCRV